MKIINGLENISEVLCGCELAVAIGNFDGVHIGHRKLIETMRHEAVKIGAKSAILTFNPHPLKYFNSDLKLINTYKKRLEVFESLGIDYLININFDVDTASLSAEDFFNLILMKKLNAKLITVGVNYRFGTGKKGDVQLMQKLGSNAGIKTIFVENVKDENGLRVSSSRIRELIIAGDIMQTNQFLARAFSIYGRVIRGDGYGKSKLLPTINLKTDSDIIPKNGVYAVKVSVSQKSYDAMGYIGFRPTINDEKELRIEAHIFDFDEIIYDSDVEVEFYHYIRGDKKFDDFAALKEQLMIDKNSTEIYFKMDNVR